MSAAVKLKPDYAEAHYMLGTALKQKGDLDKAEAALRTAIRLAPDNPGPYNTLGQLLRQKGDMEGSKVMFADGARIKAAAEAKQAQVFNTGAQSGKQ
jgi:Flp pilus assembly protein TadD